MGELAGRAGWDDRPAARACAPRQEARRAHASFGGRLGLFLILAFVAGSPDGAGGAEPFPVPPGLEQTVEFWKQVFTRYSRDEVVLYDPQDPVTIYKVLTAPDTEQGRALVERERQRVLAEYDLTDEDGRVKAQRGAKENFAAGLRNSGKYIEAMKKIFREEGVPENLAYLPLVESAFNVRARSSAGAVGIWQFMAETGRKFLRVSHLVDERRDPLAATRAAARLLKQNFSILGDWPLAITAYNHGTEGILRGIEAVGSRDLVELIRRYRSPTFGYASKNFYAEFVAALDIVRDRETYFPDLRPHQPVVLAELELKRRLPLRLLLERARVRSEQFFEWNPALNPGVKELPPGIRIKAPAETARQLASVHQTLAAGSSRKDSVSAARKKAKEPRIVHRVARGETLSKIARRYGISPAAIRRANGLNNDRVLIAGTRLRIPQG
ncbi:MAG TPA: transglycosylase SLT domain-containing protein [candidate division Zixibacteria bacterium]|nr:transglycosylase SLT domain-containing protein [candidate division Zixibacteria bacterium]